MRSDTPLPKRRGSPSVPHLSCVPLPLPQACIFSALPTPPQFSQWGPVLPPVPSASYGAPHLAGSAPPTPQNLGHRCHSAFAQPKVPLPCRCGGGGVLRWSSAPSPKSNLPCSLGGTERVSPVSPTSLPLSLLVLCPWHAEGCPALQPGNVPSTKRRGEGCQQLCYSIGKCVCGGGLQLLTPPRAPPSPLMVFCCFFDKWI